MSITDCMKALLRRELSDEECKVLRHLTVQGLAKLNGDIVREVELEVTMAIFRVVYRRMEKRREEIFAKVSHEVQAAVEKLNRMATAEELIFLNDCYEATLFKNLVDQDGKLLDDFDLENSALAYLYTELGMEADRLRSGLQAGLARNAGHMGSPAGKSATAMKCTVCHLAPMACPISFTSATMVRTNEFHRMSIGFSPMVAWFDVSQAEPLWISPDSVHHVFMTRSRGSWSPPSAATTPSGRGGCPPLPHDSMPSTLGLSDCSTVVSIDDLSMDSMGPPPRVSVGVLPKKRVRFADDTNNSKNEGENGDANNKTAPLTLSIKGKFNITPQQQQQQPEGGHQQSSPSSRQQSDGSPVKPPAATGNATLDAAQSQNLSSHANDGPHGLFHRLGKKMIRKDPKVPSDQKTAPANNAFGKFLAALGISPASVTHPTR